MSQARRIAGFRWLAAGLACALGASASAAAARASGQSPEIRLSPTNRVPSCANPERLTAFLKARNDKLDPRFADIARHYRSHGDAWRVRWDYAFFQMIVETNALAFRRGNGEPGDVKPRQNNFAGIGTTGGGVPGDSYPDVGTGVLAHIQHLVAYSGERMADPVAPRTQLKQGDIVEVSQRLKRAVRYSDLARRWAVDRRYWQSIESIAEAFRTTHCTTAADLAPLPEAKALTLVSAKTQQGAIPPPSGLGGEPRMVREPAAAQRPQVLAAADAKPGKPAGPVRTIWRDGDAKAGQQKVALATGTPAPTAAVPQPRTAVAATPRPAEAAPQVAPVQLAAAPPAATPPPPVQPVAAPQATQPPPNAATPAAAPQVAQAPARPFAFAGAAAAGGLGARAPSGEQPAMAAKGDRIALVGAAAPSAAARPATTGCSITSASYGGRKALLIRSEQDGRARFTALSVLEGFETSMADSYIRAHAPGGHSLGEFGSSADALARARELCPGT